MSEPAILSPLLDGFVMGTSISDHDGTQCYPALKEHSENKYIVKIISVPASQAQLDALLLAGAYKDPADAMDYYKEVADGLLAQTKVLSSLGPDAGFEPFEGGQVTPITRRRLGYYVYLLSFYKRSLEKHVRRNPVTHLEAINLGLDLCDALIACRQAGYLYVNLKPTNVFVTEDKRYRIGDLGLIDRTTLHYQSLPDRYRSAYSPPELSDPMASIDETADTYALGMILYQLYNDGQLPQQDGQEVFPSPINADYEIAEIILKATHPEPAQRWESPELMRAALVAYMQRNSINDTPITPYTPLEIPQEPAIQEPAAQEETEATQISSAEDSVQEASASGEDISEASLPAEEAQDDTTPSEADAEDFLPHEMSQEVSQILEQADDLIAHQVPDEAVTMAQPEDPFSFAQEEEVVDDLPAPTEADMADAEEEKRRVKEAKRQENRKKTKKALLAIFILLLLLCLAGAGFWAYQNLYVQTIDELTITGDQYALYVSVRTDADESLLQAVCSDNYGTSQTQNIENGQAVFTGLQPDSLYKIRLEIQGLHKLTGKTSDIFTTDSTTKILRFTAVTGADDGSVILNFTPTGGEPEEWVMKYVTEGEEERMQIFSGHTVTISGLTVGSRYTFTLEPNAEASLSGETTLEYTASQIILAENLRVSASNANGMTITWDAPGGLWVDNWTVRCYSDSGYEEQQTVTDTCATFENIDPSVGYTVEVTATGMTQPARTSISANPINITGFQSNESDPQKLIVSWTYSGTAPQGGWLLMYTIDSSEIPTVVRCDSTNAVLSPRIPNANYSFSIQAADSTSMFSNEYSLITSSAAVYEGHALSADRLDAHLLVTPEAEDWTYETTGKTAFSDTFQVGDALSLVLHSTGSFYLEDEDIHILYVFRDSSGSVLPDLTGESDTNWRDIWLAGSYNYGELDIPTAPKTAGDYSLSVYFNGQAVTVLNFTVN